MGRLFQAFRHRGYVWMWLTVLLANTASWSFTLAVTWQIYNLTQSSFWSGAIMFASMAPNLLGAPLVGVLADKMDRRWLMFYSIVFGVAVFVVLAVLSLAHLAGPVVLAVLAVAFGLTNSSLTVSVNAMMPVLVPRERLYNAYSLQAVAQRGTEFLGPALSSPLLAAFGVQAVYWFCASAYLVAIVCVMTLTVPGERVGSGTSVVKTSEPFLTALWRGISYIRQHAAVRFVIVLVGLHCSLTMAFMGILPAYTHELGASSSFYGVLMSMIGVGSMFCTFGFAGLQNPRTRQFWFWISAWLSGLSLVGLGLAHHPATSIVAMLVVGGSQALFMTFAIATIQEQVRDEYRGRVTSVYLFLAAGVMSIANWLYGILGAWVVVAHLMMITGALFTLLATWFFVRSRRRNLSLIHGHHESVAAIDGFSST